MATHLYTVWWLCGCFVHDFGLNRWWLWDFQLGPAPGCWGSIIEPRWRWRGTSHPSARCLEGVMHRRRCWLKVWCTTKLGLGRRHIRLVDADTVHVLLFSSWGARGCPHSCDPRDHLDCDAAGELSCGQRALSGARGHRAHVSGQYLQLWFQVLLAPFQIILSRVETCLSW